MISQFLEISSNLMRIEWQDHAQLFSGIDVDIPKTQSSSLSYAVCSLPLLRNRYAETVRTILKDRSEISNDRKWCIDRLFSETCHALKIVKAVKSSQHSIRSKEFFYSCHPEIVCPESVINNTIFNCSHESHQSYRYNSSNTDF